MTGRLGVDFGTSNTVVSLWNESSRDGSALNLGDYTRTQETSEGDVFTAPSLIHFAENGKFFYGNEILRRNLYHSPRTFQWMKRYISRGNRQERMIDGKGVSFFDAGEKYLTQILKTAAQYVSDADEEIALTVPVETFEDYSNWLAKVVHKASLFRFRVIDEPSAAAIGYGSRLKPGEVYVIFDFGGGTLDVAVVVVEDNIVDAGHYCRVLGKAGVDLGGTTIDQWLFSEVLVRNQLEDDSENVASISRLILSECERMKESLSFNLSDEVQIVNPISGALISADFTRNQFEDLLDSKNAFAQIDKTIRRALSAAEKHGYSEDDIKAVLMVGGSSQIPAVHKALKRMFGNERVRMERPLDTVARGASAFVAGMAFEDYIQHDYAIRYVNPNTGGYEYRTLVRRGTRYPTAPGMAVLTIKSSFDGQDKLGVPIFEIGGSAGIPGEQRVEMHFDENGLPRVRIITEQEFSRRNFFWINENNPTFLRADPPGIKGDPRFRLEFAIDENRRLLITAHDVKNSNVVYRDYPVVKLS